MLYLAIVLIFLFGLKFYPKKLDAQYMTFDNTTGFKGLCSLFVFASHSYMTLTEKVKPFGRFESYAWMLRNLLGQLIVAVILFYSGYGIMESIKKKEKSYIKSMPKHRIFKVWLHFALIVFLFLIYNFSVGNTYSLIETILAFVAWTKIGNANWYVFCILFLYICTYIAFALSDKIRKLDLKSGGMLITFTLTVLYVIAMAMIKPTEQAYWYNTALCYPLGMLWSSQKARIDGVILKNNKNYFITLGILVIAFALSYRYKSGVWYCIYSCLACALLAVVSVKIHIGNRVLSWWSRHMFSTFMLRALASNILLALGLEALCDRYGISFFYVYLFTITATTMLFALIYDKAVKKLDAYLKL